MFKKTTTSYNESCIQTDIISVVFGICNNTFVLFLFIMLKHRTKKTEPAAAGSAQAAIIQSASFAWAFRVFMTFFSS